MVYRLAIQYHNSGILSRYFLSLSNIFFLTPTAKFGIISTGGDTTSTLNERIKEVLKRTGMRQVQIAEVLGLSQQYVSQICSGAKTPSDRTISDICREFKVDEVWLRTGEGDPFRKESRNEQIAAFAGDLMRDEPDSFRKAFVAALSDLSLEDWKVLERLARAAVEKANRQE